ncbi:SWIM zinc finger family protein [Haloarchaeobius iranensis]|uniref:SWIM zinc finger family protein n=1 Tax=Haloarchaeobius iranensis TaxID=996166 RepID=UPI001FE00CCD|nr:SWIM zinc finger family protein [Haloarchaeobius iranensis]
MVRVVDGVPTHCTCPADEHYDDACKHRVAVAIRGPVLNAAVDATVATDGGSVVSKSEDTGTEERPGCECDKLPDGVPCWPCYRDGEATFEPVDRSLHTP